MKVYLCLIVILLLELATGNLAFAQVAHSIPEPTGACLLDQGCEKQPYSFLDMVDSSTCVWYFDFITANGKRRCTCQSLIQDDESSNRTVYLFVADTYCQNNDSWKEVK